MEPASVDSAPTEHADEKHQEALNGANPCDIECRGSGEGIRCIVRLKDAKTVDEAPTTSKLLLSLGVN